MRSYFLAPALAFFIYLNMNVAFAQAPQWDATTGGESFLSPNLGNPNAVYNATIGTAASDFATLRVRGDQLPVHDPFFINPDAFCTFRTDVAQQQQQSWWMYRETNPMGRIWHNSNNRAFHFQSMVPVDKDADRSRRHGAEQQRRRAVGGRTG